MDPITFLATCQRCAEQKDITLKFIFDRFPEFAKHELIQGNADNRIADLISSRSADCFNAQRRKLPQILELFRQSSGSYESKIGIVYRQERRFYDLMLDDNRALRGFVADPSNNEIYLGIDTNTSRMSAIAAAFIHKNCSQERTSSISTLFSDMTRAYTADSFVSVLQLEDQITKILNGCYWWERWKNDRIYTEGSASDKITHLLLNCPALCNKHQQESLENGLDQYMSLETRFSLEEFRLLIEMEDTFKFGGAKIQDQLIAIYTTLNKVGTRSDKTTALRAFARNYPFLAVSYVLRTKFNMY